MLTTSELKLLTSLKHKKYRQSSGRSIIEHAKVILDPALCHYWEKVYLTGPFVAAHPAISTLKNSQVITDKEMAKISQQTTPPGILATLKISPAPTFAFNSDLVLWLDGLRDPGNLGTIIRTAEWFGVKDIFLSPDCAETANPKTVAATMGAFWHANLYPDSDLLALAPDFKAQGYEIIATDLRTPSAATPAATKNVLIIGSEAEGVNPNLIHLADHTLKIPQFGQSESLNAAVAAGITLYFLKIKNVA